ncbi:MAG: hypothetical protein ACT4NY_16215 [Pseudonocardiales bacterium]
MAGREENARAHLTEAGETAARTSDGTFVGLHFGTRNVGIWRVALALEIGQGTVGGLLRRAQSGAVGRELRGMAYRMGMGVGRPIRLGRGLCRVGRDVAWRHLLAEAPRG